MQGSADMRPGFALELLLCGLGLGGCSAASIPARAVSASETRAETPGRPRGSAEHPGASAGPVGPRFIGRFDQSNPDAPVFAWPGTAIALRFSGTAIGVTLGDSGHNVFEVVLDGQHSVLALQSGT